MTKSSSYCFYFIKTGEAESPALFDGSSLALPEEDSIIILGDEASSRKVSETVISSHTHSMRE